MEDGNDERFRDEQPDKNSGIPGVTVEYRNVCTDCGEIWMSTSYSEYCDSCQPDPVDDSEQDHFGWEDRFTGHYGEDWENARAAVLERDNHRCQNCGLTDDEHRERNDLFGGGLHVHHRKAAQDFDDREAAHDIANLIALCAPCHRAVERGEIDV